MDNNSTLKISILLCILLAAVLYFSQVSVTIWGGTPETVPERAALVFVDGMSVSEFGQQNSLPNTVLKEIFSLQSKSDLQKSLADFGLSHDELTRKVTGAMALSAEHESKNWIKIPLKFGLWFLFLTTAFVIMRKTKITGRGRKIFYLSSVILFGIILSADPSPMGTVKDAIYLYATKHVIFPPRMIALSIFLLTVFLANKFICGWGCQIGTLQDLIFRINRNKKDTKGVLRQYKPPFWFTHSFRIAFFALFTVAAFLWATDLFDKIDPFKIYKPLVITPLGWIFTGVLLISSLFVYRPWCQLFCPFGLAGWQVEKISIFKIKVDYETCIGCEACAKACPSTVMEAILKRDRIIPDCYACGTCINVCPTNSVQFTSESRSQ